MAIRTLVLAAAIALVCGPAFAADQSVDLSSGGASFTFTPTILDGGDDVITFINLPAGTYDFVFSMDAQFIPDLAATLNGIAATILSSGNIRFAGLEGTSVAPFVLTLTGTPGASARYTGDLTVRLIPEPASYALLLAGLSGIALMSQRRKAH